MDQQNWQKTFPGSIVVTDEEGIIIEMNDFSIESYRKDGGTLCPVIRLDVWTSLRKQFSKNMSKRLHFARAH